jgi:hypothetical protein
VKLTDLFLSGFICIAFFYRPLPQSVQAYVQIFYAAVILDFPINYTVDHTALNPKLSKNLLLSRLPWLPHPGNQLCPDKL